MNCGDDAAKLEAKIEQLAKAAGPRIKHIEISGEKFLASPDGKIVAGFHGKYLLAGTGKGEVEGMIRGSRVARPSGSSNSASNCRSNTSDGAPTPISRRSSGS